MFWGPIKRGPWVPNFIEWFARKTPETSFWLERGPLNLATDYLPIFSLYHISIRSFEVTVGKENINET